ncbi:MAG TPA: trypsin-like peptidase domain-containing protein [Chloroflexota bacterium]|nr:trypsin-like peptidase domain-containing protein [Chloroflexota bacterium]
MAGQTGAAGLLAQLSEDLARAVELAGQAVVAVKARRRIPGSGVLWTPPGVVVTADHVLEREEDILVTTADGRELPAAVVGRDPSTDLAVLRVAANGLAPATLGDSATVRVGHFVLALGRAGPGAPSASIGIVSAIGGPWRSRRGIVVEGYLRTDLTLYPGFSGGPLVDALGRVIGINTSLLAQGQGMALPLPTVQRVVEALLTQGRIRRGFLGISTQPVLLPAALARRLGLTQESGLLVLATEPQGPADRAGLLIGDIVVGLAGQPVRSTDDLLALLGPERVGTVQEVHVVRGGELHRLTVTIGERP